MSPAGDKQDGKSAGSAEKKPRKPSPTSRRQEERRQEKLELIKEQVEDGSLTIRQMTPEERKKYPPKPRKPRKKR